MPASVALKLSKRIRLRHCSYLLPVPFVSPFFPPRNFAVASRANTKGYGLAGKKFSRESHFLFGNLHHNEPAGFVKSASRALNGDKLTLAPRTDWNKPNPLAELEIISSLRLFARRVCRV